MVGLLTMTGGVSLTSLWVYKRWEDKKQLRQERKAQQAGWPMSWKKLWGSLRNGRQRLAPHNPSAPVTAHTDDPPLAFVGQVDDHTTAIHYGLRTSTLALAATTTARLCYPPLQVVGLPLLIYMGVPSAQKAYDELKDEDRPGLALAETIVLAVCLAGGYYWVGSLGFWLYYGGRSLLAEKQETHEAQRQGGWLPTTARLWKDEATYVVATTTLQPGDQVILYSGEMAPVDGLITEGVAWLRSQALSPAVCALRKGTGDRVMATDIVLVGQICVRVVPTA